MKHLLLILCAQVICISAAAQELTVDDCRRMALEQSRSLRNAVEQNGTAQDNLKAYRAAFFPKFSASGNYLYSNGNMNFTLPGGYLPTFIPNLSTGGLDPNILMTGPGGNPIFREYAYMPDTGFDFKVGSVFSAGISARQPIYMGGKVHTAVRMAKIGTAISGLHTKKTEAEVLMNVDEAFFACIKLEELVKSALKYKEVLVEFYRQMENAWQSGMKSKNDLLKVGVKLNEAELRLRQARNGLRLARMNLCYHTGLPMTTNNLELRDDFEQSAALPAHPEITSRPEYAMLQQQIELKKQNVSLIRSDFLPQIAAVASYSYVNGLQLNNSTLFSNPSFLGGVSVNIPLFGWGEGRQKVSAARREVEMARNQFEDMSRQMQLELMQAGNNYEESVLEVALTQKFLVQAEESMTESGNRYHAGMETLADYLESQAIWQKAWSDLIEAKAGQRVSYTRYLKASGKLQLEK